MSDSILISALRARHLPRSLLLLPPSPLIEIHTQPGGTVAASTAAITRTTEPSWRSFSFSFQSVSKCASALVALVVRDSANNMNVLGKALIHVDAALVEGWFSLGGGGEVYVRALRVEFCITRPLLCSGAEDEEGEIVQQEGELRSVAWQPGALFRDGELIVGVEGMGMPLGGELVLKLDMEDQKVWGGESAESRKTVEEMRKGGDVKNVEENNVEGNEGEGEDGIERMGNANYRKDLMFLNKSLVKSRDPSRELKKIVEKAGRYRPNLRARLQKESNGIETDVNVHVDGQDGGQVSANSDVQKDDMKCGKTGGGDVVSDDRESEEEDTKSDYEDSEEENEKVEMTQTEKDASVKDKEKDPDLPRRAVDFGSFRFALLQASPPRVMHVQLQDKASPLPPPLGLLNEHTIRIPKPSDMTCKCSKKCQSHLLRFRLCGSGPSHAKTVLELRIRYKRWTPRAECCNVTPRFKEILPRIDQVARSIRANYPEAETLTYMFVGGFFTKQYPTYFKRNINYLRETLEFEDVHTVPIHTEGSIERNAKVIRDCIKSRAKRAKSIVLIGHSKGGVDAVSVLLRFPEVQPLIYGIISFQAPFGGTYLIDFVSRSKLAVRAISSLIETIWKGDEAAFLDMGYSARLKALDELQPDNSANTTAEVSAQAFDDNRSNERRTLEVFKSVPIVALASFASFDVMRIRSAANAAGVASMAPAPQIIEQKTGFYCDGLVTPADARVPFADLVLLDDMMHTEPAIYVKGTKYPPGQLTASALVLLFEKERRENRR